jgi:hypothetical protein
MSYVRLDNDSHFIFEIISHISLLSGPLSCREVICLENTINLISRSSLKNIWTLEGAGKLGRHETKIQSITRERPMITKYSRKLILLWEMVYCFSSMALRQVFGPWPPRSPSSNFLVLAAALRIVLLYSAYIAKKCTVSAVTRKYDGEPLVRNFHINKHCLFLSYVMKTKSNCRNTYLITVKHSSCKASLFPVPC